MEIRFALFFFMILLARVTMQYINIISSIVATNSN